MYLNIRILLYFLHVCPLAEIVILQLLLIIILVNLRLQVNPENSRDFKSIAPERAFADFLFAHVVLHLVVINFMG